jgi:hypothetical protein
MAAESEIDGNQVEKADDGRRVSGSMAAPRCGQRNPILGKMRAAFVICFSRDAGVDSITKFNATDNRFV